MAGLKDLAVDVEKMILAGNTVDDIVEKLGVPFDFVIEVGKWMQYIKTFRFAEAIVTGKQIGRAHV